MSQLSFSSFDFSLMVRDVQGRYLLATAEQILEAARQVFTSPAAVKEYLRVKLAGFEHEVFAVLFMDTQHRLIEYAEMFRGTIDGASVYPRELVKEALQLNAAAVIVSHNHPSGNPEPSGADRALTQRPKEALGLVDVRVLDHINCRTRPDLTKGLRPLFAVPRAGWAKTLPRKSETAFRKFMACMEVWDGLAVPLIVPRRSRRQGQRVLARLRPGGRP